MSGYPLTLRRTPAGSYAGGHFVPGGASVESEVRTWRGPPQPATGRDIERGPDGLIPQGTFKFYTRELLRPATHGPQGEAYPADEIIWEGHTFRVIAVARHSDRLKLSKVTLQEVGR